MAKAIDIVTARANLQNLTDKQDEQKIQRTVSEAKKHLLRLEQESNFPKIGLLIDNLDVKNIAVEVTVWSFGKNSKENFMRTLFFMVELLFIKKRC
ncbi:hypothetical protein [Sulfurimonas sp.]